MDDLQFYLFQRCRLLYQGQPLPAVEGRKVQELLCYLLLYRHRPHLRETLTSLLWGDTPAAQAKKYLRQTLWRLQRDIDGPNALAPTPLLQLDAEWVQLNPDISIWLDVEQFESRVALARGVAGADLDAAQVKELKEAVKLYSGDLLEDWYQEWCLFERERLHNLYLIVLDKLLEHCVEYADYESGLEYGTLALNREPTRERTYRRLMQLHYGSGNRSAALYLFQHCATALRTELGVEPTERTTILYRHIRDDLGTQALPPKNSTSAGDVPPDRLLSDVLDGISRIQVLLGDAQQLLQKGIDGSQGPAVKSSPQ